ncbi:DUF3889 domain-containing protein [Sporosarcina luteola]|uniref:DUF3889 domain-containing protein n=1 Tax=Sporosarcina luteola TaxID=582850 RepID=UPI00203BAB30|nr:DUF3889 domain-containing protein [Sporosarcina luteola]MCM3711398.1 YqzG/YhdC family protein [Sporosarcina luteola]
MKYLLVTLGLIMSVHASVADITIPTQQHEQTPAYAKWGALAVKETKQKYPDANIVDYLHIGSETKDDTTIEKFKLWLKDDQHEFGVIIHITFTTKTDNIIKIDFQETDR